MLRFLRFTRRHRLGDPIRVSGVQPGGSLAGKVSFKLWSIFSSVDSATVMRRRPLAGRLGHQDTGRGAATAGRPEYRDRNFSDKMISAAPNISANAPSHQVRTTAPDRGATIMRKP